jgi:phage portal protein BeeE
MLYPIVESDMFHIKTPQLKGENGLWAWGTSPYSAAIPVIEALESNYSSRVSLIRDRGALGMLTNESEIPDKEATKEVQDALNEYGTMKGQKKYIATPEKLKWHQMSLNTQELQLIEQGTHDFGMMCSLRGLDPLIFNASGSTYANQEQGIKESYRRSIIPFVQMLYNKLEPFTKFHFGGLSFSPDWASVEELQDGGTEFSTKVIAELSAGILSPAQAFEMLYEETDMKFEGTTEEDKMKDRLLNEVMIARENGSAKEEVELQNVN